MCDLSQKNKKKINKYFPYNIKKKKILKTAAYSMYKMETNMLIAQEVIEALPIAVVEALPIAVVEALPSPVPEKKDQPIWMSCDFYNKWYVEPIGVKKNPNDYGGW